MRLEARRYEALDSLRGVCACIVALFHFQTDGLISNLAVVRNGWLFVDFFFVLSGFVIASAYWDRLRSGYPAWKYLALRLGRIWPLHLFVLALFVALELALASGMGGVMASRAPFGPGHGLDELAAATLMANAFGLFPHLGWNPPSWSIGAEYWVYVLFALLLALGGRRARWLFALAGAGAFAVLAALSPKWLGGTYDFGFVRCLLGFSLGVLIHPLVVANDGSVFARVATPLELGLAGLCLIFVSLAGTGSFTLAGPFLFAGVVYVFACEQGVLSRLLRTRPLLLVGALSYSIYMLHAFLQGRLIDLVQLYGHATGQELVGHAPIEGAAERLLIGGVEADLLTVAMLLLLIGAAWLSYRFIELPGRRWARARVAGNGTTDAAEARAPTF